jgi:hypothetical protein
MQAAAGRTVRNILGWPFRLFTPFRTVMLVVVAAVAATGYWSWHTAVVGRAETDFMFWAEQGQELFQKGEFLAAADDLENACRALDIMRRDDSKDRIIRQMSRETTALRDLCRMTLFEIVDDASEARNAGDRHWEKNVVIKHQDRWVVLDTVVLLEPDPEPVTSEPDEPVSDEPRLRCRFSYPLMAGNDPVHVVAGADLTSKLAIDDERRNVVIAAQFESCTYREGQWTIRLRAETAFLWVHAESLKFLGFFADEVHPEEPLLKLLQEQARLMGLES